MLDQLEKLISQYSQEVVSNSNVVPNEKQKEVSQAASGSIIEIIKEKAASQDFSSLMNMLSNTESSTISTSDLGGDFIKKLTGKGIDSQLASTIASTVLPLILSKLSGNSEGGLGNILGQLTGGTGKGGDLASALGGILGKSTTSATKGKTDLGGALGKLKDLF